MHKQNDMDKTEVPIYGTRQVHAVQFFKATDMFQSAISWAEARARPGLLGPASLSPYMGVIVGVSCENRIVKHEAYQINKLPLNP